ncbi:hypothetical protein M1R94_08920 [Actinotalea sp. K2]|nr:hypothetical protein [Actinotalea sp. K2]
MTNQSISRSSARPPPPGAALSQAPTHFIDGLRHEGPIDVDSVIAAVTEALDRAADSSQS